MIQKYTCKDHDHSSICPTKDAEDNSKDAFYEQLQETLDRAPHHDIILLIGNFNTNLDN